MNKAQIEEAMRLADGIEVMALGIGHAMATNRHVTAHIEGQKKNVEALRAHLEA